jgi:hypothetical protein
MLIDRVTPQAIIRRPLTAEARDREWGSPFGFCQGQRGTVTDSSPIYSD